MPKSSGSNALMLDANPKVGTGFTYDWCSIQLVFDRIFYQLPRLRNTIQCVPEEIEAAHMDSCAYGIMGSCYDIHRSCEKYIWIVGRTIFPGSSGIRLASQSQLTL